MTIMTMMINYSSDAVSYDNDDYYDHAVDDNDYFWVYFDNVFGIVLIVDFALFLAHCGGG